MVIQFLEALVLGIIQGLTEFLPVSSTGHLIIFEHIFGVSQEKFGLAFDAALHLGTAAAVFVYFWEKWKKLAIKFFQAKPSAEKKIAWSLLIATVPAAIIGVLFEKTIETAFRNPHLVAWALIFGSLIIYLAEKLGKKLKNLTNFDWLSSLIIGFSQSLALVPGISRSGITISTGMFLGMYRKSAAEFAFLLSGPIILGAGGKKLLEVMHVFTKGGLTLSDISFFAVGMAASTVAGFWTIKFLMNWLSKKSMNVFVVYRIILAMMVLLLLK
jgi:undecaprenyl-diphosphatase